MIIGTHVDDLMGIAYMGQLDRIEQSIEITVELTKRGRPQEMLGIELTWSQECIMETQQNGIETMTHMHDSEEIKEDCKLSTLGKGSSLPLDEKSFQEGDLEGVNQKTLQSIVGGLLFIA